MYAFTSSSVCSHPRYWTNVRNLRAFVREMVSDGLVALIMSLHIWWGQGKKIYNFYNVLKWWKATTHQLGLQAWWTKVGEFWTLVNVCLQMTRLVARSTSDTRGQSQAYYITYVSISRIL